MCGVYFLQKGNCAKKKEKFVYLRRKKMRKSELWALLLSAGEWEQVQSK